MAVAFQVAGVFYETTVELSQVGGNTVGDIVEYLHRVDPDFHRLAIDADGQPIISMFGAWQRRPFTGRAGIQYPAGFYELSQTFTGPMANSYIIWEYCLSDENSVRQPPQAALPYTKAQVQDGWSIHWRLVTVLNGPGTLSPRPTVRGPKRVAP
ncbi:hypothetical protein [Methylobacterium sp. Leaf118]|uniref:hypothetical protein n=1 Tax=Methylobacterium sp. Leaf118 TaxID=2876562 RepID=UPI001E493244|nr:hypothetical protein [Methylobacterium sp. Leaf118]